MIEQDTGGGCDEGECHVTVVAGGGEVGGDDDFDGCSDRAPVTALIRRETRHEGGGGGRPEENCTPRCIKRVTCFGV